MNYPNAFLFSSRATPKPFLQPLCCGKGSPAACPGPAEPGPLESPAWCSCYAFDQGKSDNVSVIEVFI